MNDTVSDKDIDERNHKLKKHFRYSNREPSQMHIRGVNDFQNNGLYTI